MIKIFGGGILLPRCEGCKSAWIREIECENGMRISGKFKPSPLEFLSEEDHEFVILFLRARGNLKELERYTGEGYFALRGKLEKILKKMNLEPLVKEQDVGKEEIFDLVKRGKISVDEALNILKGEGEER